MWTWMPSFGRLGAFALAIAAAAASPAAQDADSSGEGSGALPDLKEIQQAVADIRKLPFTEDVPASRQSLEDCRRFLVQEIEEVFPAGRFEEIMQGLLRLGMLKERIDIQKSLVDAMLTQAVAYYDPERNHFYYLPMSETLGILRETAAHELVHALQDQHFDLDSRMVDQIAMLHGRGPRQDDAMLAYQFLVEGEASYVMNLFVAGPDQGEVATKAAAGVDLVAVAEMARNQARFLNRAAAGEGDVDIDIPDYILAPLVSSYGDGAYFVLKLREMGGWDAISAAHANPPRSVEQCLHPEKYLGAQCDEPTPMALPLFQFLQEAGWMQIDEAIHGEAYLRLLLRIHGSKQAAAGRASAGWDGDIYRAWRNEQSDVLMVLATTWDTTDDAREFFEAYKGILPAKYAGSTGEDASPDRYSFECGDGLGEGVIVLRGQEVFIAEGADDDTIERLIAAMLDQTIEHVK